MKLHHLKGYIQSIYLVEYEYGLLMLDGACRADVALIKNFITHVLQRPLSDLRLIVVTHVHPDHAGAARKLRQLSGCKIASAQKAQHWYQGFSGWLMHKADMFLILAVAVKTKQPIKCIYFPRKLIIDIALNDLDRLPDFSEWQVLETPGHTDRDLALMHVPSKLTYVADDIIKVGSRFICPFPVFRPARYRQSLQRYIDLEVTQMLLAHGGRVDIDAEQLTHLIRRSPRKPMTHWRIIRQKVKRVWARA